MVLINPPPRSSSKTKASGAAPTSSLRKPGSKQSISGPSRPSDKLNPKTIDPFASSKIKNKLSPFALAHINGELPYSLNHGSVKHKLHWKTPLERINYAVCLPLTAEGLVEQEHPFTFLSRMAWTEMLQAPGAGDRISPLVLRKVVAALRVALQSQNKDCFTATLAAVAELARLIGERLNEHFKALLPPVNKRILQREFRDMVIEQLQIMEECCGPEGLKAIKLKIPMYTSINF
eukprot:Nk52_evm6s1073 gene=Nk52_evmTU6s1073